jgi:hypothetical protein
MFGPMPPPADNSPRRSRLRPGRWLAGLAAALLVLMAGLWLTRIPLTASAIGAGLRRAGAGDIRFSVARASPWSVQLDDLFFRIKAQQFAARRVTLDRTHWWKPTLGAVHIEGARMPVVVDGSDVTPGTWTKYSGEPPSSAPTSVPIEELSIDGVVAIQAASLPEQPLTLRFAARQLANDEWAGTAHLTGPGLSAEADASYAFKSGRLAFHVTAASLDLKTWQDFIQRIVVMPGGAWEMAGALSATAEGIYADHKLTLGGQLQLRDGSFSNTARGFSVGGVDADLAVTDFTRFQTQPGTLRVRELHSGGLTATDVNLGLAFKDLNHVNVSRAALQTLGGTLSAEPFSLQLDRSEVEATVLAEGLDVVEILALSKDVPGTAVGRVNGRLPIRIDESGLRFGTGWLELKSGVRAEVQLKAAGLLTGGVSPSNPSYGMLQRVESGLLRLHVTELRLDVRPPNAPPGRSAQLHIAGEPVDPTVKAPVTLDLNVNGPIERLINLGMDKRVNFGSGK